MPNNTSSTLFPSFDSCSFRLFLSHSIFFNHEHYPPIITHYADMTARASRLSRQSRGCLLSGLRAGKVCKPGMQMPTENHRNRILPFLTFLEHQKDFDTGTVPAFGLESNVVWLAASQFLKG